jgi:hypothetical protein
VNCNCGSCTANYESRAAKPHVCPEPEIIVVEGEFMRNLQRFVDDLARSCGRENTYETLRLILDKMEKGLRVPE